MPWLLKCICRPELAARLLATISSPSRELRGGIQWAARSRYGRRISMFRFEAIEWWSGRGKWMRERPSSNRVTGKALAAWRVCCAGNLFFVCQGMPPTNGCRARMGFYCDILWPSPGLLREIYSRGRVAIFN